jgi:hypothetical protein
MVKGLKPVPVKKENTLPPSDTHCLPTHRYHLRQEARVRAPSEAAAVSMAAEVTPVQWQPNQSHNLGL